MKTLILFCNQIEEFSNWLYLTLLLQQNKTIKTMNLTIHKARYVGLWNKWANNVTGDYQKL